MHRFTISGLILILISILNNLRSPYIKVNEWIAQITAVRTKKNQSVRDSPPLPLWDLPSWNYRSLRHCTVCLKLRSWLDTDPEDVMATKPVSRPLNLNSEWISHEVKIRDFWSSPGTTFLTLTCMAQTEYNKSLLSSAWRYGAQVVNEWLYKSIRHFCVILTEFTPGPSTYQNRLDYQEQRNKKVFPVEVAKDWPCLWRGGFTDRGSVSV